MTKQKKWSDMDTETRAHARDMMRRFEQSVCSEATSARARRGILKMRDPFGAPRRLHLHQVVAAQRLLLKHRETPWEQRKSALLAIHDLGLGKTITAVLAIAKVLNKCPDPDAAKVVVLCPLAVLSAWDDALRTWTTLGDRVLVGHRQAQLTEAAIEAAQVVLTTPDVLMAAFKTFVYQGASEEDRKKPKMQRFHHGVAPSDATRREQLQGALPPIHPMFALLTRRAPALALTVVDELHRCCNPTTITGHVVAMFCADSVYTLGLTGTPVTSQPKQMAHLAKALNAQPPKLQQPAFLVEARNARVLNEAAIAEYHARLVDRVKADVLNLPPKRYALLEYDPWIGREPDGRTNASVVMAHNEMLASAQKVVAGNATEARELAQGKWGERERAVFTTTVALGHYEFCGLLGVHGAAGFKSNPTLYDEAVAAPSECIRLILRMLRSRQAAGHPRIVVYSECVTQLKILERYLDDKGVGALFLYDGHLSGVARGQMVHDFLHCASGVLLLSGAGAIGIDASARGARCMFSVGRPAVGPGERGPGLRARAPDGADAAGGDRAVRGAPRASTAGQGGAARRTSASGSSSAAARRGLLGLRRARGRPSCGAGRCRSWARAPLLDDDGQLPATARQLAELRAWRRLTESLDARGLPHPPMPAHLPRAPQLAEQMTLPEVAFPC